MDVRKELHNAQVLGRITEFVLQQIPFSQQITILERNVTIMFNATTTPPTAVEMQKTFAAVENANTLKLVTTVMVITNVTTTVLIAEKPTSARSTSKREELVSLVKDQNMDVARDVFPIVHVSPTDKKEVQEHVENCIPKRQANSAAIATNVRRDCCATQILELAVQIMAYALSH